VIARRIRIPSQGQVVEVRRRRYVVVDVVQSGLPGMLVQRGSLHYADQGQHLVTLSSVDDTLGEDLQVIWEIEPGTMIIEGHDFPQPDEFDSPQRLVTFLHAVRWGASSNATTKTVQAPFRSGIDIEDYQLEPLVRAIQMPRVNLLIADDVGLGKTIEAGLVCQELLIRNRVRKILIVCPAALQIQWRDQMRDKFGLEFRIVDSALLKHLRRARGLHVNPWTHFPRLITSIDYLKRDRPMRLLSEVLPPPGESPYPRRFDLLILDEAHNVAPAGKGRYATDSLRTAALRRIAPHFEHKLFLSATPHNGYTESFTTLLELLDNQRFARGISLDRKGMRTQLEAVMVRRLKSELKGWNNAPRFAERRLNPIEVSYSEQERQIHRLLQAYANSRLQVMNTGNSETEHFASEFVLKLLKKRLFSSPAAFAKTLQQHEETLNGIKHQERPASRLNMGILRRQIEQLDEEGDNDDEWEASTGAAIENAAPLFRPLSVQEQQWLTELRDWATQASKQGDSKYRQLITWLHTHTKPGGHWSNTRVIIFTEYRATQAWLHDMLAGEGLAARGRLLTLYGGMDMAEREQIKAAFQADPAISEVRILLATDAASEGIDLQNYCSHLIHYEIPWNPNRLEQRNGRIDRHGQRDPKVHIYHFVSDKYDHSPEQLARTDLEFEALDTGRLDGDLEFLWRALHKVNNIRHDLGKVGPVIAQQVEEAMFGKRALLQTKAIEGKTDLLRELKKSERKMQEQITNLHNHLQESKRTLDLTPDNIQAVVETALDIAGKPPLRRTMLAGHDGTEPIEAFYIPPLDGSWQSCRDGLLHPYTGQERPIVFDYDKARGRDDVVLAHLNHRLVAMSLRLLRTALWNSEVQHRLHRVTACTVPNVELTTPAVIAHARLLLLGGDSQLLHEELVYAGLYLHQDRLRPIGQRELERLLDVVRLEPVSANMQQSLRKDWPKHQRALTNALQKHEQTRLKSLRKTLEENKQKEISNITTILHELRESILTELHKPELQQLELFTSEERRQFDSNKDALIARAEQIESEIAEETVLIEKHFANPQPRLFPVSIIYLVPERLAYA
jgi:ERCC4-related helicase